MKALLVVVAAMTAILPTTAQEPDGPRTVVVTVRHSRFLPAVIEAREGEELQIVVRNEDFIDHELIAGDDAVHDRHERGTEGHHGAVPGEISVPAWSTGVTSWTVQEGTTLFACHLPGHFAYGMQGVITTV